MRRQWKWWLGVAAVLVALCAPSPGAAREISVATYNVGDVGGGQGDVLEVARTIRSHGVPDVVFLQEIQAANDLRELSDLLGLRYFTFTGYATKATVGVGILSRYPLQNRHVVRFSWSWEGRGALSSDIEVDGTPITLVSLHMDHIRGTRQTGLKSELPIGSAFPILSSEIFRDNPRSKSVDELLAWLDGFAHPEVVIGGDFNTIPISRAVRKMSARFRDALALSSDYFAGTYSKTNLPIQPRLDYIFFGGKLSCLAARIIREGPGDHYPVHAVLDLRDAGVDGNI